MVSSVSSPPSGLGDERATRNKIAKLARLHLQLSACEEQLGAVERQDAPVAAREVDRRALTAKIAAIKAEIAELAREDASPAARAAEEREARQRPPSQRSAPSVLDVVRLAMVKEGHLGTLVNVRA